MTRTPVLPSQATLFDPRSDCHRGRLTELYGDYLLEEFGRTRVSPDGHPVGPGLTAYLFLADDSMVGFGSVDTESFAAELIYVDPRYRRHGIAGSFLARLGSQSPTPLRVRAPLSPAGAALSGSLGLLPVPPDDAEEAERARGQEEFREGLRAACGQRGHKRRNPSHACRRCHRTVFTNMATLYIGMYCEAVCETAALS
jgi:GNAT superfamily N-acetyltransferase